MGDKKDQKTDTSVVSVNTQLSILSIVSFHPVVAASGRTPAIRGWNRAGRLLRATAGAEVVTGYVSSVWRDSLIVERVSSESRCSNDRRVFRPRSVSRIRRWRPTFTSSMYPFPSMGLQILLFR